MLHAPEWLIRLVVTGAIFSLQLGTGLVSVNASRAVPNQVKHQTADGFTEEEAKGSWGRWGPWSSCTRTCGGGVMQQTRPCLPRIKQRAQPTFQFATGDQSRRAFHIPLGRVLSSVRHSYPLHRSPAYKLTGTSVNQIYQISNRAPLNTLRPRTLRAKDSVQNTPSHQYSDQVNIDELPDHLHPTPKQSSKPMAGPGHRSQLPLHQTEESTMKTPFEAKVQTDKHTSTEQILGLQKQHRSRVSRSPPTQGFNCLGDFRQYKSCNSQPCPHGSRDFREVQCAAYNNRAFTGKHYEWEPFTDVSDSQKCELNCRAIGYKFYVRHAAQVIDGTPCESGSLNICVNGECKKRDTEDLPQILEN